MFWSCRDGHQRGCCAETAECVDGPQREPSLAVQISHNYTSPLRVPFSTQNAIDHLECFPLRIKGFCGVVQSHCILQRGPLMWIPQPFNHLTNHSAHCQFCNSSRAYSSSHSLWPVIRLELSGGPAGSSLLTGHTSHVHWVQSALGHFLVGILDRASAFVCWEPFLCTNV